MADKKSQNASAPKAIATADAARLRGETLLDEKTIRRWARGETVNPATRAALVRAARKLGIQVGQ